MRVVRLIASCLALGAVMLGVSAPASGAVEPGVVGRGVATPIAAINSQEQLVQFNCTAIAYGVYSSTSVDSCTLHVYDSQGRTYSKQPTTFPGNAAVTSAIDEMLVATDLRATLEVCWNVSARPPVGEADRHGGCTIVNTLVAA